MFDCEKIHITEIQTVMLVEATRHPEKTTVFAKDALLKRYELIYKIDGENHTHFNGKTLHILPGTVYFLPKCTKAYYQVDRILPGECIDIFFDTDYHLPCEAFAVNCEVNHKLRPLFESLCRIWTAKKDGYYYKCMAIFYEILGELQKNTASYLPSDKYKLIEKGVDFLHAHFCDDDISYTSVAELCGISYSYFKRLFTERFGLSPVRYVTRLKTDKAKELLSTDRYSVTEVSELCGFKNVYYFSRVFKKENGISPKSFK